MTSVHLPPALFVTWQNRAAESRKIYPVGRLLRLPTGLYEFSYVKGALAAQADGFGPFLTFPNMTSAVRSKVMPPFFANRVMASGRPDYEAYVRTFGLALSATADEILARSEGRRATDTVEVFAEPTQTEAGEWGMLFFVRSVRHVPEAEETAKRLTCGDRLFPMLDVQNPKNPHGIVLRTEDNRLVGLAPDYLTEDVSRLLEQGRFVDLRVEKVNPSPVPAHYRVLVRATMRLGQGEHLFRSAQLEPIASDATAIDGQLPAVAVA